MDKKLKAQKLLEKIDELQKNNPLGSFEDEISRSVNQIVDEGLNKVITKLNNVANELVKLQEDIDKESGEGYSQLDSKIKTFTTTFSDNVLSLKGNISNLEKTYLNKFEQVKNEIDSFKEGKDENTKLELQKIEGQFLTLKSTVIEFSSSLNSLASQIQDYSSIELTDKESFKKQLKNFESNLENLRIDILSRMSLGGGTAHRKILNNGTEIATRYADINLIGSGISIVQVNNTTTKQTDVTFTASGGAGSGDVVSNTSTSVDSEIALFSGTDGKTIKRATITGLLKATSGVISAASAGTDYMAGDATLTALAAYNTNGFLVQTAADTFAGRTLTAGQGISISNPVGTAGNPTFAQTASGSYEVITLAVSDETTALTTGTAKITFRMPFAMTLSEVRINVNTAPTGSTIIVDVKESGTTIFSTKPSIDASTKTSVGAGTPAVISDSSLADDAEITVNIDQVGSTIAGKGLKLTLIGYRT